MPTPVFDSLNVRLAYRLGDPYTPDGDIVTYADDGIAYPASMRDDLVIEAARRVLTRMGARAVSVKGVREAYVRAADLTATETQLPADCAQVLDIDYYGKRVEAEPFTSGRRSSVYWQNVPMYRIDQASDEASRKVVLMNIHKSPFTASMRYLREIPALTHGGAEDLTFDVYMQEHVLDLAEALGRRLHQEFPQVYQMAAAEMQIHKDNE
jgi:hypothetical protein